jgi:hypothetical protein
MNENNIVVGKFPGSTTEINQPADQNPFKATKSKLKTINDSDIEDKVIEKEKLEEMILLHETNCGTTVSPTHKRYIKYGILRVRTALQQSSCAATFQNSFIDTGIYPFSMDRMIRNCKVQLPDTERHHWSTKLDEARELMLEHGELTDALLDELKIGNNMNTIKDNYIIPRRRMIF